MDIFRSQKRSASKNIWGSTVLGGKYIFKKSTSGVRISQYALRTTRMTVHLRIGDANCEHLATTALLAISGNRRIASLNRRMCHWRLSALWMKLRVWSVTLSSFGIATAQISDRTKGKVLWPPGLPDLQLAVEPSKGRNLLENV